MRRGKYYKYENGVKGEECSEDHDHEEEDEHVHEEGGSHHEDEEELLAWSKRYLLDEIINSNFYIFFTKILKL